MNAVLKITGFSGPEFFGWPKQKLCYHQKEYLNITKVSNMETKMMLVVLGVVVVAGVAGYGGYRYYKKEKKVGGY